ncbi:sarcosine oxidase subunit gamma [Fulvimarina endophytica]|uniref:Sarcosine oxidase subunit gamma n=1 Tax=Fulvimarina endophytica TaxID=2293836 RepID=A0A371X7H0_9HYPH|nr:sarcosine oxidase subunit gamma family protein [Fulvimarina endophytica]RFC65182.1 sarcosine oxidase subunit gamma [Fulvimarina endophytica]
MLEVNLAKRAPAVFLAEQAGRGPIDIVLQPTMGRLSFRAKEAALEGRSEVSGLAVDGAINTRRENGDLAAMRLGPDEWMFLCDDGEVDNLAERIAEEMSGKAFSLVDVSHRDVTFEVSGAASDAVIASGSPLDLSLEAFPVGMATRTIFAKSDIVLARLSQTTWQVTCWRSFATYVQGYLADAAKDFAVA